MMFITVAFFVETHRPHPEGITEHAVSAKRIRRWVTIYEMSDRQKPVPQNKISGGFAKWMKTRLSLLEHEACLPILYNFKIFFYFFHFLMFFSSPVRF